MKATKFEVTIKAEVLSIDSVPALLIEVSNRIEAEFSNGTLDAGDGDHIEWETTAEDVEF